MARVYVERMVIERLPCWQRNLGFDLVELTLTIYCDEECVMLNFGNPETVFKDKAVGEFLRKIGDKLLGFFKSRSLLSDHKLSQLLRAVSLSHDQMVSAAEGLYGRAKDESGDEQEKRVYVARANHKKRVSQDYAFVLDLLKVARKYRIDKGHVDPESLL